ncbi:uncharacterized protein LOC141915359 [Tubulanus polymorphus]|uniref:uncharacterized protein LOC141915359 n=1 Tax=Tubulanus polymorphus TaxID=672921 RepID=UPI003DA2E3F6
MGGLLSTDSDKVEKMAEEKKVRSHYGENENLPGVKRWPAEPPDILPTYHLSSADTEQLAHGHQLDELKKTVVVTNTEPQHIGDSHSFSNCILRSSSSDNVIQSIGLIDYKFNICNKCGHSINPSHQKVQPVDTESTGNLCSPEVGDKELLCRCVDEHFQTKTPLILESSSLRIESATNHEEYLSSSPAECEQSSESVITPVEDTPKRYSILDKFSCWVNEIESRLTRPRSSTSNDSISRRRDYDNTPTSEEDRRSKVDKRVNRVVVRSASDSTLYANNQQTPNKDSLVTYILSEHSRCLTKSDPNLISVNHSRIDSGETTVNDFVSVTHVRSGPAYIHARSGPACIYARSRPACIHDKFFKLDSKLRHRCKYSSYGSNVGVIRSSDRLKGNNLSVDESISLSVLDGRFTRCTSRVDDDDETKHDKELQPVGCFNEYKQSDSALTHRFGNNSLAPRIKDSDDENFRRNPIVITCETEYSKKNEQIICAADGDDIDTDDDVPVIKPNTCGDSVKNCIQTVRINSSSLESPGQESNSDSSLVDVVSKSHRIKEDILPLVDPTGYSDDCDNVSLEPISQSFTEIDSNSSASTDSAVKSLEICEKCPRCTSVILAENCDQQFCSCEFSRSKEDLNNILREKPRSIVENEVDESIADSCDVLVDSNSGVEDNLICGRLLDNVELLSESDSEDTSSSEKFGDRDNNNIISSKESSCDSDSVESAVAYATGQNIQLPVIENDYSRINRSRYCDNIDFLKKADCKNLRNSRVVNYTLPWKSIENFPNITVFTTSSDHGFLTRQKSRFSHIAARTHIYTIEEEESECTSSEYAAAQSAALRNEIDTHSNNHADLEEDGHQSDLLFNGQLLDETLNSSEYLSVHNDCNTVINEITDRVDFNNAAQRYRQFLLSARRKSTYDTPGIYEELLRLCNQSSFKSSSSSSDNLDERTDDTSENEDDDDDDDDDCLSQYSYKSSGFEVRKSSESGTYTDESEIVVPSSNEDDENDEISDKSDVEKRSSCSEESDLFTDDDDNDDLFAAPVSTFQRFSRNRTSFRRASIDLSVYGSFRRRSNSIACLCPTPRLPQCTQSLDLQDNARCRRFSTSVIMEPSDDVSKSGKRKNIAMTKTIDETKNPGGECVKSPERRRDNLKTNRNKYGATKDEIPRSSRTGFDREIVGQHLSKIQNSPYLQKYLEKEGIGKYNLSSAPRTSQILSDPKIQKYLLNRGDGSKALERAIQKPKTRSSQAAPSKPSLNDKKDSDSATSAVSDKSDSNDDKESKTQQTSETVRLVVRRTSSHSDLDKLKEEFTNVDESRKPTVKIKDSENDHDAIFKEEANCLDVAINGDDSGQNKTTVVRSLSCSSPRPEILVTDEAENSSDAICDKTSSAKSQSSLGGFSRLRATFLKSKFYIPTFEEFKRRRFGSIKVKKPDFVEPGIKRTASVPVLNDEDQDSHKSQNLENRHRKLSHDPRLSAPNLDAEEFAEDCGSEIPVAKPRIRGRTISENEARSRSTVKQHGRCKTAPEQSPKSPCNESSDSSKQASPKDKLRNKMKMFDKSKKTENEDLSGDRFTRTRRHKSDLTGTQTQEKIISQPKRHKSDVTNKTDSRAKKHLKYVSSTDTAVTRKQSPLPKPREKTRRKGTADKPELGGNNSDQSSSSPNIKYTRQNSKSSLKNQPSKPRDRSLTKRESSESLTSISGDSTTIPRRRNKPRATTDRPVSANLENIHKSKCPVSAFQPSSTSNQLSDKQESSRSNSETRAARDTLIANPVENRLSQSSDCLSISGVSRSTSDVTDIKAEEKRKMKKPRAYKSDPFKSDEQKANQYFQKDHLGRSSEDLLRTVLSQHGSESLPSLDCDTDISSEFPSKRFSPSRKIKKISNVSTTSVDSGVIGHASSREHIDEYDRFQDSGHGFIEVERVDSGVGYDISKDVRDRYQGLLCEDCDQPVDDSLLRDEMNLVCKKCQESRVERKEAMQEIVDTEISYGRDLKLIREEFLLPMQKSSLLSAEQLQSIFLNLQELIDINDKFSDSLLDAIELANEQGDEDLHSVRMGNIFMDFSFMFIAFENYCVHQAAAAILLEQLEKEKELFRIFLQVSQTDNHLLRRMNLKSFLMIPVQRIMRYPLLLSRLYKATPHSQDDRSSIRESQLKIEEILEHINSKTKIQGTSVGTRIKKLSVVKKTSVAENIELQKVAFEIIGKNRNEAFCVHMGKLNYAQPTDITHWQKKGKGIKFTPAHGIIIAIGKSKENYNVYGDQLFFPKKSALSEGILVLLRDKGGKYVQSRDPLSLEKCVVTVDSEYEDVIEIQDINRETLLLKADASGENKVWLQHLKYQAKDLGMWRRRRHALPNIMFSKPTDS